MERLRVMLFVVSIASMKRRSQSQSKTTKKMATIASEPVTVDHEQQAPSPLANLEDSGPTVLETIVRQNQSPAPSDGQTVIVGPLKFKSKKMTWLVALITVVVVAFQIWDKVEEHRKK